MLTTSEYQKRICSCAKAYDDDLVRNYNLLTEFMVDIRDALASTGIPSVKEMEVTSQHYTWLTRHKYVFCICFLSYLAHKHVPIGMFDLRLAFFFRPWCTTGTPISMGTGVGRDKLEKLWQQLIHPCLMMFRYLTPVTCSGHWSVLRIGRTWRPIGCMLWCGICISWFANRWTAGGGLWPYRFCLQCCMLPGSQRSWCWKRFTIAFAMGRPEHFLTRSMKKIWSHVYVYVHNYWLWLYKIIIKLYSEVISWYLLTSI